MKRILIVGGAGGIGLSMAAVLDQRAETEKIYIVDKAPLPSPNPLTSKAEAFSFDLTSSDYSFFDRFDDIDTLIITAGFGRLALFQDVPEEMIQTYFAVNTIPAMRLVKRFYNRLLGNTPFRLGVMVSIAGYMSSPFFALYGATKAALRIFIESVNVELEKAGSTNRVLNVSPGSIRGTGFSGGATDLDTTRPLAEDILQHLANGDDLFIPQYDEVFRQVLQRAHDDFRAEGLHSYDYKLQRLHPSK